MVLLLLLNVFLLWYVNRPAGDEPPLSAYKAVCQDISDMTEQEKFAYISDLKERADGSGDSLIYTDSPEKECTLIDELYEEISAVSGYDDYLASVQKNSSQLDGISIFRSPTSEENFGSRNIAKSAADHAGLSSENICWFPSKGMTMAVESRATDLLLLLSVFLFIGQLITEEKGKGLFAVTRSTKRGLWADMGARIAALLIHSSVVCLLLYGSNLIVAGSMAGIGKLSASLQSLAPYVESSFPISLGAFLTLGLITKIGAVFLLGLLLAACAVYSSHSFMPQLIGIGFLGLNWILYAFIPSYSHLNLLKHLSYFSLLRTDALFGTYFNLNIMGFPLGRTSCSLVLLAVLLSAGIAAVLLLFRYGNRLSMNRTSGYFHLPFHPHNSLFRHEGYKMLIANRGLLILLAFVILLGWNALGKNYTPSAGEQYYQSMMLSLEGELTEEKEAGIKAEQSRYDEAFDAAADVCDNSGFTIIPLSEVTDNGFNDIEDNSWIWGRNVDANNRGALRSFWGHIDIHTYSYAFSGAYKAIDKELYNKIVNEHPNDVRKGWFSEERNLCPIYKFFPVGKKDAYTAAEIDRDWLSDDVLMRIEEMYLVAAESAARNNDVTNARAYLKKLVEQRYSTDGGQTADAAELAKIDAMDISSMLDGDNARLYYEWRIELWGEGRSLNVFKRFNPVTKNRGDNHFSYSQGTRTAEAVVFQIPSAELYYNLNLRDYYNL